LDEFYENPRIKETHIQDIFRLTEKEAKILELLRKKGVKEVRVRLGDKGKGILMVEVVEEKNINSVKDKIRAILDKEKVQNIRISTFEGNLLLFEETTKMKL
jgi:tRNA A-37 threonylcarbamoyl transferase component Bud32